MLLQGSFFHKRSHNAICLYLKGFDLKIMIEQVTKFNFSKVIKKKKKNFPVSSVERFMLTLDLPRSHTEYYYNDELIL